MWRLVLGRQKGSFPCRSGYAEQPRANHYHLDAPSTFSAAPGPDGFHMAPRHRRHNLCKAQHTHTQTHTPINLVHTQHAQISVAQYSRTVYRVCVHICKHALKRERDAHIYVYVSYVYVHTYEYAYIQLCMYKYI